MNASRFGMLYTLLIVALLAACEQAEPIAEAPLGSPLPGLDANSLARFRAGETLFNRVFTPQDGLGPLFNDNQCSACHTLPATGGTGDQFLVRASRYHDGQCDVLREEGGENLRLQATPLLKAHGIEREPFPAASTERARFNVPFVFGMGLVEAVPSARILERADPDDRDRDGISGRPGLDANENLLRFGRKAEHATLRSFIENAAHFEMGLTTPAHPEESRVAGRALPKGVDPAPELELSAAEVELLTDFVRYLNPPARQPGDSDEEQQRIEGGEQLFQTVGCSSCHVPRMTTGPHPVPALNLKQFPIYSDLLLHDMGPGLANVCSATASPTELRTEPLIGLGRRSVYLHDSRTNDLWEAISFHGGEAAAARERFRALNELQQHELIRFLRSL